MGRRKWTASEFASCRRAIGKSDPAPNEQPRERGGNQPLVPIVPTAVMEAEKSVKSLDDALNILIIEVARPLTIKLGETEKAIEWGLRLGSKKLKPS